MSGVEIVGVVLGVLPLVLEGLESVSHLFLGDGVQSEEELLSAELDGTSSGVN